MNLSRFLDFLFPPRADEAVLRGIESDAFLALLAPELVMDTHPETVGLLPFHTPAVRAAIHEAKYRGSTRAFALLAAALAEYLRDADELGRNPTLVPVPLGAVRRKERGFNQVEAVAREALRSLGETGTRSFTIEANLLRRVRETESQVSLPRAKRLENMRGAIGSQRPVDPSRTYIVLDDVITTGATLQAAIDALKEAGAVNIVPLALAH